MKKQITALCLVLTGVAGAVGCHKPSADEHVKKGNAFFEAHQYPEAIIAFRQALQLDPKLGDVRLRLGDAYVSVKDPKNALAEYVRAADLLPKNVEAQLKAGSLLLMVRAFEDAKTAADRAIALDPKNVAAQVLRGNAQARLKDATGAINDYEEAIALDPTNAVAYRNLAMLQYNEGKREDAEATFRKAVESAPKSVPARLALANFLWSVNRLPEAEQALKDTLAVDPLNASTNRTMGLFYFESNRPEAETYFLTVAKSANTSAAQLALADYYIAVKRYEESRKVLSELAGREDAHSASMIRLASIDTLTGDSAHAMSRLHELLQKDPNDEAARIMNARLLLQAGKRDEALAETAALLSHDNASARAGQAYFIAGQAYAAADRLDEAIRAYEEVLKHEPRPLLANMALARTYLARGAFDKATTYAQQALAIRPSSSEARALLVRSHLAAGNVEKANTELVSLQKAYANSTAVINLSAAVHIANNRMDAAKKAYQRTLQLEPSNLEALSGIAQIDLGAGRAGDAIALVDRQLKENKSFDLLVLAARVHRSAGDMEKTETLLQQAVEIDPSRLYGYQLLGRLYVGEKRVEEAKQKFQDVLKRDPKSVPASTMIAMLLEQQGKKEEAEKTYQHVLTLNPRASIAANNLAWMYVADNRSLDQALQLAQAACAQAPDDPNFNDTLGWIYYRKDMAVQAVPHLEISVDKAPNEASYQFHLGMAYVKTGAWPKARRALQKALELKPGFDGAAEATKALAAIG